MDEQAPGINRSFYVVAIEMTLHTHNEPKTDLVFIIGLIWTNSLTRDSICDYFLLLFLIIRQHPGPLLTG